MPCTTSNGNSTVCKRCSCKDAAATQIALWRFGNDLTLVPLPGEVMADYVRLIEDAIGPRRLWVSAHNHDVFGYLLSKRVLREGGYEMRDRQGVIFDQ